MYFSTALTLHWDGKGWSLIRNPADGWVYSSLTDVSAASPTDVWAVGSHSEEGITTPLALHWDGVRWMRVRTPPPPGTWREFFGVSAIGPSDVWAVGDMGSSAALIMHWDGSAWRLIPSPPLNNGFRRLYSVSAIASEDVWAAGWQFASGKAPRTLIEHWDGLTWRIVSSPNVGAVDNYLWGIDALAADDVWAVGEEWAHFLPLVEHWDGAQWTVVPGPDLYGYTGSFRSVASVSPANAVAVGSRRDSDFGRTHTLAATWDGTSWVMTTADDPGYELATLSGVAAISSSDAWAVGIYDTENDYLPLTERRCFPA